MNSRYSFQKRKYGFFVHFVHGISCRADGSMPQTIEETVKDFNVPAFADAISAMGVEYLIFTAWHARALPLYPSAVSDRWRGPCSPSRDLLGEIIDAITARGMDMILYTHPRDGHDFSPEDQLACGWGKNDASKESLPSPDRFDYETWNQYTAELYSELLARYGSKISGIYTDGSGPYSNKSEKYENTLQVVNYLTLRNLIKANNPALFLIQNHFGYLFSDDFEMPEGYFHFETDNLRDCSVIPVAKKALALCPFVGNWWPLAHTPRGFDARKTTPQELARFAIFNASCTAGGGTCFAAGPYCEGSLFPCGVLEDMTEVGRLLRARQASVLDAVPSQSYPTISGDTLRTRSFRCFTESEDGQYEYLHLFTPQASVLLPLPADGARLHTPVSLTDGLAIEAFEVLADGYRLALHGNFDTVDSVIRFTRIPPATVTKYEWLNDTDKRLRYEGAWQYVHLMQDAATHTALGSFESDYHVATAKGNTLFTHFEGDTIEIYGNQRPGNGRALVYIDGVLSGELCEDALTVNHRVRLFSSIRLYGGIHTLYVVTQDGRPFELDAIRILA